MLRTSFNSDWTVKRLGESYGREYETKRVELPYDAMLYTERNANAYNGTKKGYFENGVWEYSKTFFAPEAWRGKRIYLEFEGAMTRSTVYINGNYAASHANGYTEFTVDITDLVNVGADNVVKVVCKTGDDSRWYSGAGLYRNVNLLVADKLHIKNNSLKVRVKKISENSATLCVKADLSLKKIANINIKILYGDKTVAAVEGTACGKYSSDIVINDPFLWSDETPELYSCVAEISDGICRDVATEKFGIRTISVDAENGLTVNGKPVKLRGACIHHDHGIIGAASYRDVEYRKIKKLKEAGFNAVRSAHNPIGRNALEACDELGMYVMDEAFDSWQINKSFDDYACDFDAYFKSDIRAMIDKDYNHPSVIMYSIGNEISDLATDVGVKTAKRLATLVKRLDDTRPTTVAINGLLLLMYKMNIAGGGDGKERKKDVNEAMASMDAMMKRVNASETMDKTILDACDAVDIAGYNYMKDRYESDKTKYPERVIVGSETYPRDIAEMWRYIANNNNVIGDFTWTGWDYLGETGVGKVSYEQRDYHDGFYGTYPWITAQSADIDITGFRNPISYYREIVFGLRQNPYIAVHRPEHAHETEHLSTWGWSDVVSSWSFDGFEDVPLKVDVYGKGEVELLLNGKSVGKKVCGDDCKCVFTVPYSHGILEARSSGRKFALVSAEKDIELKIDSENKTVRHGGLAFYNIAITDKNGNVHYGKDRKLIIDVTGGELLGFGSGVGQTEESYVGAEHTTYDGRAFAVVKAGSGDKLTVTASSGNLTAQCTVKVE